MKLKIIERLEKIFWVLGVLSITLLAIYLGIDAYRYLVASKEPGFAAVRLNSINTVHTVLVSLGDAFFLLLMSSVFSIILGREKISFKITDKLMQLTCSFKAVALIVGLYTSISLHLEYIDWGQTYQNLARLSFLPIYFMKAIYVITIFVLYKYFIGLEKFKTQVI